MLVAEGTRVVCDFCVSVFPAKLDPLALSSFRWFSDRLLVILRNCVKQSYIDAGIDIYLESCIKSVAGP